MLAFGMGGCLCCLVSIVILLGLILFLRVLITWLKLLLVVALLAWFLVGILRMDMILLLFLALYRIPPMFGLTVVLSLIRSLAFPPLVLVSLLTVLPLFWDVRSWGQVDLIHPAGNFPSCRGFCSVPGPFQYVQRAELWGVILAVQSSGAVHLGVDNLNVVRHVGRLLDGRPGSIPFELLEDGDLLLLIDRMIRRRAPDTVRISKVKGHADEAMVLDGRVREVDRLGNNAADEAADFGRRRVGDAVIDARRNLSGVCNRWYPVLLDLHRFFIAISRAVVNHDGGIGTAPDPLVWSAGALPKRRRLVHAVRDRALLPGPPGLWYSVWVNGLLVKWVSFLGTLHWPAGGSDLGVGGISYVEHLTLYELRAGERLSLEKATPRYLRPGRPISVSAVPFGPGIDIWRSCRFIGALMRSFCLLPGGLGRFVACSIGANH